MVWLALAFVSYVLSYSTVPVAGQCTVSSCAFAALGSEESLQASLEEHDHRLETMNQNMCSAFEKLEAAVKGTNARGQEKLCQDLKTLYYNMSVNLEKVSEKIPVMVECPAMQEQEEYLNSMNLSLAAMIARTDEHVQAVNENHTYVYQNLRSTLQTVNRIWDERFQVMQEQHQNISLRIDKIDERFEDLRTADDRLLKAAKGHDEILERMHRNQSNGLQTANESLVRVLDEKLDLVNEQLSSRLALMNGSVFGAWKEYDQKLQTINETLSSAIDQINEKLNAILGHVNLRYARHQGK